MKLKNIFMLILLGSSLIQLPMAVADEQKDKHDDSAEKSHAAHDEHGEEHHDEAEGHEDEHGDEHAHKGETEDAHGGHDEHGEEGVTRLSAEQMQIAGVVVKPLQLQQLQAVINAPGEVRFNTYKTASITPRISAQLIERHVVLGEQVKKGQPIVTLSSVEMAEAQSNVLVVDREWKRVKKLGRKVVSERRFTEARVKFELAKAKVRAYGMTETQIKELIDSKDFSRANGRFALLATTDGTVLREDHINGHQIEPGQELNLISDESSLWVLAKVTPSIASNINIDNNASVQFNGKTYPAKVSQISHVLDEITRTTGIRLIVENLNDALHPGLFVNTQIETSTRADASMALSIPEAAVMRSADGDWQVLVEQDEAGEFKGVEIKLVRVINGRAIIEGLKPGTAVVVEGAFFVQSELAKSGFEVHNH